MKENTMTMATKRIFHPCKYYIADEENQIIEFDTMLEAKMAALATDVILVALDSKGNRTPVKYTPPANKADKIVVDFDKKVLTIEGKPVTICNVECKVGDNDIPPVSWQQVLAAATLTSKALEIKGTPPIEGKDITNEMSDL